MAGRGTPKKPALKKKKAATRTGPTRKGPTKPPAKKKTVAPKKTLAKKKASPARKLAPKKKVVPARKLAPKKKVAPARKLAPKKKVAPKKRPAAQRQALTREKQPVRRETERPMTTPPSRTPPSRPSERVLATCAELPIERPLTDEEREAMAKVSDTARHFVGADGTPAEVIDSIATFLEDVRGGRRDEPKSQDVRLGLGVLWGEQLRAQVGWCWVHLTYPDGFASYALVPDDRAFACFPLNRVPEALRSSGPNTSAHVFESIREGTLPARKANAYLVLG